MATEFKLPTSSAEFVAALAVAGIVLPLRPCSEHEGSIVDANNHEVFVVDPNCTTHSSLVARIGFLLAFAANGAGGIAGVPSDG
jgi:hypothetical protein